jgi:alkylation response protein AidB-like acyl-CoA dehydrogenase
MIADQDRLDRLIHRTRQFVREVAIPNEDRVEREDRVGDDLVAAMRQLGTFGWSIPKAYGGSGLTTEELALAFMELTQCSVAYRVVGAQNAGIGSECLIQDGTQEQKDRYVLPALAAEEVWCQLFSEPGAGSDLAGLSTRAVRDGDEWVVNGQKVWTTGAHYSKFGILIARTDPDAPKHKGITYFICPMDSPGIEIRTIKNIAGAESFNEVFFTDVRIPHDNVVGEVNDGWRLAKVTLGNERVSLSTGGVLWGAGSTALDIIEEAKKLGPHSAAMRQRLARLYIEHTVIEIIRMRTLTARLRGEQPGPEASIRKIMADEHGQRAMEIARDITGADAMIIGDADAKTGKTIRSKSWYSGYMFSKALTIGGGTGEVQRNILGERVLGLPVEPDPEKGLSWADTRRGG